MNHYFKCAMTGKTVAVRLNGLPFKIENSGKGLTYSSYFRITATKKLLEQAKCGAIVTLRPIGNKKLGHL